MTESNRREFLIATAAVGGGMALSLYLPEAQAAEHAIGNRVSARPWLPPAEEGGVEINPWIVIGPDDRVLIRVNQSELGQGVLTSNPMMICEELECDWSKVQAVYADPNRHIHENYAYDHLHTEASSSVRLGRVLYQQAGASARERLKAAAAAQWGVPVAEVTTKDGVLSHKPTGRTLRYGEVAAKAATIRLDKEPAIKTPDQYTLIGTHVRRFDVEVKSRAEAVYGIDVRLPGMVYAAAKQCPSYGGSLKSFDFDAIRSRPGVIAAVPMEGLGVASGIAVVADTWWRAKTALDAMPVTWNPGPHANLSSSDLFDQYRATLDRRGPTPVDSGDVDAALRGAAKIVEAEYHVPHQAHAQMEPPNCTAQVTENRAEVWFGTQAPDYATLTIAKLTGLATDNVFVHNCFEGGGFGRGGLHGELEQAVTIAKALNGRPVKLLWTREEDLGHVNGYHPMGVGRLTAALGPDGMPTAIWIRVAGNDALEGGPLIEFGPHKAKLAHQLLRGFHLFPYGVPNLRVEVNTMKTLVPCAPWRSTGTYANVFYLESFVEEMARAAGQDPIAYRRALISRASPDSFEDNAKADWLEALDLIAAKAGWGRPLPKGTGIGFAIDDRKSVAPRGIALVAMGVTVSVSPSGVVTIERMDIVHDRGHAIINPEAAERQIRSMMAWSLGPVFSQEISIRNAAVEQSNFHDYAPIVMSEFPRQIDISYMRTNRWISGIGEEVVPLVAPAILNAIHMATGKRIRSVPLRNHDLSWS
jgi:isoquinoline 1-oxidoreductase beta subunit